MMLTFLATFVVFALVISACRWAGSLSAKAFRAAAAGSSLGMEKVCDCPEPCDARKKRMAREQQRII
jgi:hypothetical protein